MLGRAGFAVAMLVSCGRVGFTPLADSAASGGDCTGGDGVCLPACLGSDPDCMTTCGDDTCVGNAGETCTNCSECDTLAVVCGNGNCQSGEDSSNCYQDCGPTPWSWIAAEDDLLVRINDVRASGYACPNNTYGPAPSLAPYVSMQLVAREWAWGIVHQNWSGPSATCDGRSLSQLAEDANATCPCSLYGTLAASPAAALTNLLADPGACDALLRASYDRIGVGVAIESGGYFAFVTD